MAKAEKPKKPKKRKKLTKEERKAIWSNSPDNNHGVGWSSEGVDPIAYESGRYRK